MFTGIVEEVGSILARVPRPGGARVTIGCSFGDLALGESVAVSGVCLTVDAIHESSGPRGQGGRHSFEADCSVETLASSTFRDLRVGAKVNLERALKPTSRLGGHLVSGHVDVRARLLSRTPLGEATAMAFELPSSIARFVAPKGSIAIDGVSLTVNTVRDGDPGAFDVVVIPHTLRATTLFDLPVFGAVNLEVDTLARYVARQLGAPHAKPRDAGSDPGESSLLEALRGAGYL
jgi:riboflavin synthase